MGIATSNGSENESWSESVKDMVILEYVADAAVRGTNGNQSRHFYSDWKHIKIE